MFTTKTILSPARDYFTKWDEVNKKSRNLLTLRKYTNNSKDNSNKEWLIDISNFASKTNQEISTENINTSKLSTTKLLKAKVNKTKRKVFNKMPFYIDLKDLKETNENTEQLKNCSSSIWTEVWKKSISKQTKLDEKVFQEIINNELSIIEPFIQYEEDLFKLWERLWCQDHIELDKIKSNPLLHEKELCDEKHQLSFHKLDIYEYYK